MTRAEALFYELHAEVGDMRLQLALLRDERLNPAELTAMLEVYGEFGR